MGVHVGGKPDQFVFPSPVCNSGSLLPYARFKEAERRVGSSLYQVLLQSFRWWRIRVVQPAVPFGGEWQTVQTFRWRSTWVVNRIDRMSRRSILSCIAVASQEAFCLLDQACSVNQCVEFQGLLKWTGISKCSRTITFGTSIHFIHCHAQLFSQPA